MGTSGFLRIQASRVQRHHGTRKNVEVKEESRLLVVETMASSKLESSS